MLVNITGRDREPAGQPQRVHWLKATADGWEPEDPDDDTTRRLWSAPRAGSSPAEELVGRAGEQQRRPKEDPTQ